MESSEYASGEIEIGGFLIRPGENSIYFNEQATRIEPKVMHVLTTLAAASGEVVSRHALLENIWHEGIYSDEVVTRAISHLRKAFRQYDSQTEYVTTVSKRGYKIAKPTRWTSRGNGASDAFTDNNKANQLYLQGRSLNARINGDTIIPVARDLLEQAVSLDPEFAEAHAELAHSYTLMGTYIRRAASEELLEKATYHASQAIALKANLAFPKVLLAIAEFTKGNMVAAIELNEEAIQLEPDNAEVVMRLGYFYTAIGRIRHAIPILEKAVSLDPAQGRNLQVLALAKLNNGDLEEADELAQRAIDLHHYFAYDTYASVAVAMGKYELAQERFIEGRKWMLTMFDERFNEQAWELAAKMGLNPKREDRLEFAKWLNAALGNKSKIPEVPLLQGLLRCGAAELYFKTMGNCLPIGRHGSYLSMWADTEPCRDIYTHPKFIPFAQKVGMYDAWERFGWPDRLSQ